MRRRLDVFPGVTGYTVRKDRRGPCGVPGFSETVADKTGLIKRQVKGDLDRFKRFIESRGRETGAWRGDVPRSGA